MGRRAPNSKLWLSWTIFCVWGEVGAGRCWTVNMGMTIDFSMIHLENALARPSGGVRTSFWAWFHVFRTLPSDCRRNKIDQSTQGDGVNPATFFSAIWNGIIDIGADLMKSSELVEWEALYTQHNSSLKFITIVLLYQSLCVGIIRPQQQFRCVGLQSLTQ